MSAAVPWIGVLRAMRSASKRSAAVGRVQVRQEAPAPEERAHGLALPRRLDGLLHEARDARVALEVRRDEARRLLARDAELLGERAVAHAVDDAEVDRLGGPPLVGRHLLSRLVEDERRGARVHVLAAREGVDELGVVATRCASTRSSICE